MVIYLFPYLALTPQYYAHTVYSLRAEKEKMCFKPCFAITTRAPTWIFQKRKINHWWTTQSKDITHHKTKMEYALFPLMATPRWNKGNKYEYNPAKEKKKSEAEGKERTKNQYLYPLIEISGYKYSFCTLDFFYNFTTHPNPSPKTSELPGMLQLCLGHCPGCT